VSANSPAWSYNDKVVGGTDISTSVLSWANIKSTAVAAGLGFNYGINAAIGNDQYTGGYYDWSNTISNYARAIDKVTGVAIDPDYYQINDQPMWGMPDYNLADVSRGLALSNCSNSGDYILSAWYDGEDVGAT